MKRAWLTAAALIAIASCAGSGADHEAPTRVTEIPIEAEEHFLVCTLGEREIGTIVERCVLSPITSADLVATIEHWGKTRGSWNDHLFDTRSFAKRYVITADEKACLKSAFCHEMEREETDETFR